MNIKILERAVARLTNASVNWQVWLYRLNRSSDGEFGGGSKFGLDLSDEFRQDYFAGIQKNHLGKDGLIGSAETVREYQGDDSEEDITWLPVTGDSLIASFWRHLSEGKVYAETTWFKKVQEVDRQRIEGVTGVYISEGEIGEGPGFLLSRSPLKKVKFGGFFSNGRFREFEGPILTLPTKIDAIYLDGRLYFLTGEVRNQLLSKAAIAAKTQHSIEEALKSGGLSDERMFRDVAARGNNPRRMLKWKEENFEFVKSPKGRKVREKFQLGMAGGKLKVDEREAAERLIKLVTGRGMVDPFTDGAQEVSSAKPWR